MDTKACKKTKRMGRIIGSHVKTHSVRKTKKERISRRIKSLLKNLRLRLEF